MLTYLNSLPFVSVHTRHSLIRNIVSFSAWITTMICSALSLSSFPARIGGVQCYTAPGGVTPLTIASYNPGALDIDECALDLDHFAPHKTGERLNRVLNPQSVIRNHWVSEDAVEKKRVSFVNSSLNVISFFIMPTGDERLWLS